MKDYIDKILNGYYEDPNDKWVLRHDAVGLREAKEICNIYRNRLRQGEL